MGRFLLISEYTFKNEMFYFSALNKVFKFADVEESGKVDVATIATLAVQLMGGDFNEAEKELVNKKAELQAESGNDVLLFVLIISDQLNALP